PRSRGARLGTAPRPGVRPQPGRRLRDGGHRDHPRASPVVARPRGRRRGRARSPPGRPRRGGGPGGRARTGHGARRPGRPGPDPRGPTVIETPLVLAPTSAGLARAGAALASGSVVAVPTDTVYGLAAD